MQESNTKSDQHLFKNNQEKIELGQLYHRSGNLDKAEEIYREILNSEPHNPEANHHLGLIALQSGKYMIAREFIKTALELKGNDPIYLCNLGTVHYMQQEYEQAEALYLKAIEEDPEYAEAHANLGKLLEQQDRITEAKSHLKKGIQSGRADANTLATQAQANLKSGNLERAEILAQRAINKDSQDSSNYSVLIDILLEQDKEFEVINLAQKLADQHAYNQEFQDILSRVQERINPA